MNECFAYICISTHCVHVVPVGSEMGVRSPGCGITEGCEHVGPGSQPGDLWESGQRY